MLESRDDPEDRPVLRAERIPIEQIPVVDFTPFRTGDPRPAQRKQAAIELAGAFRNVGFAEAGRFFALPLPKEEKAEVAVEEIQLRPGLVRHRHGEPDPDR